ncbi:hypothetical protein DFH08DRAFT_809795 [Mycena albidolilacea]|uniref:Uncharacterized protein n=1 Tax=Mycena albidolilacea TaxID=1033008 RepID=A0AAD7A1E4_9AGAR|nr:hypothetical protein DFH08DRAFT_809795 [Mycena albidolilacea]
MATNRGASTCPSPPSQDIYSTFDIPEAAHAAMRSTFESPTPATRPSPTDSIRLDSDLAENSDLFTHPLPGDISLAETSNLLSTVYVNEHSNEEDEEDQLSYTPEGWQTCTLQPQHPLVDTYGNEALSDGVWSDGLSPLSTITTTEGDVHEEQVEEQVSGGYPRHEATPPPQNTPTYLRSKVQAMEKRAADPMNLVPPAPVPTNPTSSMNPAPPASAVKFKPAAAAMLKCPAQHPHVDVPDAKRVALPEGKSTTGSFDIMSPVQFHGDLEDFLNVNQFQSVPIPAPPHGFQLPNDPMPVLIKDDDEDNDCAADDATADAACSATTGFSVSRIVNAYMRQLDGVTARKDNGWNIYQLFAKSTVERRLIECRQESTPHLTVDELRGTWVVFKQTYSKEEMDELLAMFAELNKNKMEEKQSLWQQQSKFSSHEAKLEVLLNKLSDCDSIEAFLILIGPHVNEDAELARIITTPVLQMFVQDILLCDNDLIAAAKLTYTNTMRDVKVANSPNSSVTTVAIEAIAPPEALVAEAPVNTKPSKTKQKGGKFVPVKPGPSHQDNIKSMPQRIAQCCIANTGLNLFNLYLCDARLPELYPAGKVTGAWHVPELCVLNTAMDAWGMDPNAGLRFQQQHYSPRNYVILSHDYRLPTPPTSASVDNIARFWCSSGGSQLPCTNGKNQLFEVDYDLCSKKHVIISVGREVMVKTSELYLQPLAGGAALCPSKPVKGNKTKKAQTKHKRPVSSDEDDEDDDMFEPEDKEPTSLHPQKRQCTESPPANTEVPLEVRMTRARSVAVQEGDGNAQPVPAPVVPRPVPHPANAEVPPEVCTTHARSAAVQEGGRNVPAPVVPHPVPCPCAATAKATRRAHPIVIESSDSEAEHPKEAAPVKRRVSPRKQKEQALLARQVMDCVVVPPSPPIKHEPHVGHPFRTMYNRAGQPVSNAFETDEAGRYYMMPKQPPPALPISSSSSSCPPPPTLSTGGGTSSGSRPGEWGCDSRPIAMSSRQSLAQPAAPVLPTSCYGLLPVGPICAPPQSQSLLVPPIVMLDDVMNAIPAPTRSSSAAPAPARSSSMVPPAPTRLSLVVPPAPPRSSSVVPPAPAPAHPSLVVPPAPPRARSPSVAPLALPSVALSPASSSVPQVPPNVAQMLGRLSAAQMQVMLISLMTQASERGSGRCRGAFGQRYDKVRVKREGLYGSPNGKGGGSCSSCSETERQDLQRKCMLTAGQGIFSWFEIGMADRQALDWIPQGSLCRKGSGGPSGGTYQVGPELVNFSFKYHPIGYTQEESFCRAAVRTPDDDEVDAEEEKILRMS